MTSAALSSDVVAKAFLNACHDELSALKPGNVHIHSPGHNMTVADFEKSANAAAPVIANLDLTVGERIERAVMASFNATGCNTNLGIILLAAPLAHAVIMPSYVTDLRERLGEVLANLSVQDARHVFPTIMHVSPGGLGKASQHDVRQHPEATLLEAMQAAADRDRIANAYTDNFSDFFDFALPTLQNARKNCATPALAITTLHMSLLAEFPDTHIARKHGKGVAEQVQKSAADAHRLWRPAATDLTFPALMSLDGKLKSEGLNPGTTADFVVATLFAEALIRKLAQTASL